MHIDLVNTGILGGAIVFFVVFSTQIKQTHTGELYSSVIKLKKKQKNNTITGRQIFQGDSS